MATAARASAVSAVRAAIRVLRKGSPPQESEMRVMRRYRTRAESFARSSIAGASWTNVRVRAATFATPVRAPPATIPAPPFPRGLTWLNVAPLRMDKQKGRPVLVEFWDFCRVNSLRTLPYLKAWHERYADAGLRVIGVHTGAFPPSRDEAEIEAAVARLGIEYPVVIDMELEVWDFYGNEGWPGRYLWDTKGALFSMHYGEGAYRETELRDPGAARRRARHGPAGAPGGRARPAAARPDRGSARRLLRPLRGGRRVGGAVGPRRADRRRPRDRDRRAGLPPARRAPAPHRAACSSCRPAPGSSAT